MKFENMIISPSIPVWKGSEFEAPVDGIYIFEIKLHIRGDLDGRRFRIEVKVDGSTVDHIQANTQAMNNVSDPGTVSNYRLVQKLSAGQKLVFYDAFVDPSKFIVEYGSRYCYSDGKSHGCSMLTGRLMKPL